jgi:hypothetical protein
MKKRRRICMDSNPFLHLQCQLWMLVAGPFDLVDFVGEFQVWALVVGLFVKCPPRWVEVEVLVEVLVGLVQCCESPFPFRMNVRPLEKRMVRRSMQ